MITTGFLVLLGIFLALGTVALTRRNGSFQKAVERTVEQFVKLMPRLLCALTASGFVAQLIPSDVISRYLSDEAGMGAVLIAAATGLIVPAGPVVAFSVAAVFAAAGASAPALIAFITSWSLFAAHRIFIYEIPLLGLSFLRLRLASASVLPILAGLLTLTAVWLAGQGGVKLLSMGAEHATHG